MASRLSVRKGRALNSRLVELFEDIVVVARVKDRLPRLFHLAELECSRGGKVGMEVGNLRERILVALLIWRFGEDNVDTSIAATKREIDARVFGTPLSIKTVTVRGKTFRGVKLTWTVDATSARRYYDQYYPVCDIIFAQISWGQTGGLYYLPFEAQEEVFGSVGREGYLVLPKPETNPRGVEVSAEALRAVCSHNRSRLIEIRWERSAEDRSPYKRWVEYWRED